MIDSETVYLFRHALLRDAAYQLQPPGTRAALHAVALELLESILPQALVAQNALELAFHASQCDSGEGTKEVQYRLQAAEFAFSRLATGTALEQWALVARHPGADINSRERALRGRGDALRRNGYVAEALESYHQAMELLPPASPGIGRLKRATADCQYRLGKYLEAEAGYRNAIEILQQEQSPRGIGTAWGNLGLLLAATGRSAEAEAAYHYALAEHKAVSDEVEVRVVQGNLANLLLDKGRPLEALELLQEAEAIELRLYGEAQPVTTGVQSSVLWALGKHEQSNLRLVETLQSARRLGMRGIEATCLANLADAARDNGQLAEGLNLNAAAMNICAEIGDQRLLGSTTCSRGHFLVAMGRISEGLISIEDGLALLEKIRASVMLAQQCCHAARVHLQIGRLQQCEQYLGRVRAAVSEPDQPALFAQSYQPVRLRWLIACGRHAEIANALQEYPGRIESAAPGSALWLAVDAARKTLSGVAPARFLFGYAMEELPKTMLAALPDWWRAHHPRGLADAEQCCPGVLHHLAALDNAAARA